MNTKKFKSLESSPFYSKIKDESGIALITALLIMIIITALGTAAIMTSRTDVKIGENFKKSTDAFYAAEAGLEAGLDFLDSNYSATDGWNSYLNTGTDVLGDGILRNEITSNLSSSAVGSNSFNLYTRDDNASYGDDADATTDSNLKVFLTSRGNVSGASSATAIIETYVEFDQGYDSYGGKDLTSGNTNVATGKATWGS